MLGIQPSEIPTHSPGRPELAIVKPRARVVDVDDALPGDLAFLSERRVADELEEDRSVSFARVGIRVRTGIVIRQGVVSAVKDREVRIAKELRAIDEWSISRSSV